MASDARGGPGPAGALRRPRFEADDRLTACDLRAEQAWRRQRLRRHNRRLHGWGVVCGLWVVPAFDSGHPWGVLVCPGYALGPYGDEILVPCRVPLDLRDWVWSRPDQGAPTAYVAIRHRETARAPAAGRSSCCGCNPGDSHDTRLAEGVRIDVLWEARMPAPAPFDLCHDLPACPPCPDSPYLLLASIALPRDEASTIGTGAINNQIRNLL